MKIYFTVPGRPSRWMRPVEGQDGQGNALRFTDHRAERGKLAIAQETKLAWGSRRPLTGPVLLRVVAIFAIPPSWPKRLQAAAMEGRVWHMSDPDLDQIVKQVKDALKGIAYVDDNQVAGYLNHAKRYGHPERTDIEIEPLPQLPDAVTPGQARLEKRIALEGWDAVLAPVPKRRNASKTDTGDELLAILQGRAGAPAAAKRPRVWRGRRRGG